uniref:Ribonuclease H n=1 Tax=viral metagenome TaxID=1070528 RepID=A0A6C0EL83_9ZZZZ
MYSVYKGYKPGIYNSWDECKKQINGYSGAKFKKFDNILDAKEFLKHGETNVSHIDKYIKNEQGENPPSNNGICVYTDGGCYGNGNIISYGGYGIYFGDNDSRNVSKLIKGSCTNNICELNAILEVLDILKSEMDKNIEIHIYSDSEYSIKAFTTSGDKYHRKLWNPKPSNMELIKKGYYLIKSKRNTIHFHHVYSHTNINDIHSLSNEKADKLATLGLKQSIDISVNLGLNKFKNGKYKNKTLIEVAECDKSYLSWYLSNKPYKKEYIFHYIIDKFIN